MRQAGRYLPEYRKIRERHSLLEICAQPDLAAEVTLQPVHRLGVDAAIIFADILLPLAPMGIQFDFRAGEGPVIHNPIRAPTDVDALRPVQPREALAPTLETIGHVRSALRDEIPVIGFAGAPFTLASYCIEGGPSKHFLLTKRFMFEHPDAFARLLSKLATVIADFLIAQIGAGAAVVQLFDSWVGCLTPSDYATHVAQYSRSIFQRVGETNTPAVHFGVQTAGMLEHMTDAGGDVIGIDWRVDLDDAWRRIGHDRAIQGNLDPALLLGPRDEVQNAVRRILDQAGGRPGHIFNLGHGVLPETSPDALKAVVDWVHSRGR
jgi:uroporphyrinogen decarboxylase